jgi:hypothetical protein
MRIVTTVLALVATGLLAACGGSGSTAKGGESGPPTCAELWVAGQELPADYTECRGKDDEVVKAEIVKCSRRDQQIATYEERFVAILGGKVVKTGPDSAGFRATYAACFGGGG